jgi:hypothetical protein
MITLMSQRNFEPIDDASPRRTPTAPPRDAEGAGLWRQIEQLVVEHPKQCLAAAALAGVLLGWIIKRRP